MELFVNTFFEKRLEQLFDLAQRVEAAFAAAGLEYRVVGGLATYLYVEEAEPDAGRLTKDIDIAVRREDLPAIAKAVQTVGLEYRHVAGIDMLIQTGQPSARRAVHLYPAAGLPPCVRIRGFRLVPLVDLIGKKLTSYRIKDQMYIIDLDEAGLITPEIEAGLSDTLRDRLAQARARQ